MESSHPEACAGGELPLKAAFREQTEDASTYDNPKAMKLMQLENPHFDWPFEASQHMIHLIVTGAFRRNVLR